MTIERIAFQGDVAFVRVAKLPDGVVRAKDTIVAHSETGHHHVSLGAVRYEVPGDPMVCYLSLEGECEIRHLRPHDTHESIALGGGPGAVWQVRRQREYTPEGWRKVED